MNQELIAEIKNRANIDTVTHCGAYALMQKAVEFYASFDLAKITIADLTMLFRFCINKGHSQSKLDWIIDNSNLSPQQKSELKNIAQEWNYEKLGIFGSGSMALQMSDKVDQNSVSRNFIKMLVDVSKLPNDNATQMFDIVRKALSSNISGMTAGIASQILHLVNPDVFPVLNNIGQEGFEKKLVLTGFNRISDVASYADNAKLIYDFREKYLKGVNFRTIDAAFWEYQEDEDTKFRNILKWFVTNMTRNFKIEKGIINEEPITGKGDNQTEKGAPFRKKYDQWRIYDGFELDIKLGKGFDKANPKANFVHRTGTAVSIYPVFDEKEIEVSSLQIGINQNVEGFKPISIGTLGIMSDGNPTDELEAFLEVFKAAIKMNAGIASKARITEESTINDGITYWLGGASYDSGGDMTEKFIDEGIYGIEWFYESIKDAIDNHEKLDLFFDKYNVSKNGRNIFHLLLQMKPGDKIAIKSTNYKTGVFYIKAIGVVIKSAIDGYSFDPVLGHTIPVEWEQDTPFSINDRSMVATYAKTIHQVSNKEHIDRIFNGVDDKMIDNKYNKDAFLKEVYISGEQYDKIVSALMRKKNIILQGAPGVGKSFLAQRLAYSVIGKKDKDNVAMIQFHQSYSYEDFVMGYKPNSDGGFELKNGVFYEFCEKAKTQPDEKFYFIIDEINRGNLSKILGEIMLLIESDKRGVFENEEWECAFSLKTTYGNNGEKFFIPDNVYIIGLMNTADRSLALLDYALRRRFSFVDISPAFENGEFISYIESCKEKDSIENVIKVIKEINQAIENDSSLGKGFRIGHSYFCNLTDIDLSELEQIVLFEIFPLIEEYWIENESEVKKHKDRLTVALNG